MHMLMSNECKIRYPSLNLGPHDETIVSIYDIFTGWVLTPKSVLCLLSSLLHQQSCLLCGKLDRIFDCEYRLLIERFILLNIAEVRFINILKSMSKIFFWLRVVLLLGCYDELVVYSHWFFAHIYRTCNTLLTRYRFLPVSC